MKKKVIYFKRTLEIINKERDKSEQVKLNSNSIEGGGNYNFIYVNWEDEIAKRLENTCSLDEVSFDAWLNELEGVFNELVDTFDFDCTKEEEVEIRKDILDFNVGKFLTNRAWIANVNAGKGYQFFQQLFVENKVRCLGSYISSTTHKKVYIFASKKIK